MRSLDNLNFSFKCASFDQTLNGIQKLKNSNYAIKNEEIVRHLGIHMDVNLSFGFHVNQVFEKASKKLHALARICKYMDIR